MTSSLPPVRGRMGGGLGMGMRGSHLPPVAAGAALAATGTPATAQWGVAYSDTAVTASGGTAPYSVSGLPSGLSGSFVGGALTISGTPV